MKKWIGLLVLILPLFSTAQPVITFQNEIHDFGEIVEGKVATHEFVFTNTGNAPLIIQNVQASCGCTSPFWTKEPIMPGKTGTVKASYNSEGRPGPFHKSLTVTSNASNTPNKVLYIRGQVISRDKKIYSDEEKARSPIAHAAKNVYKVGKLEVGQAGTAKVNVTNLGKTPLEFTDLQSMCGCVTFQVSKPSIAPGESAVVELTIRPRVEGPIKEEVTLHSNDILNQGLKIIIEGEAIPTMNRIMGGGSNPFK